MRILVVGAGATGGYFGARLGQAGRDVSFLVRPGRAALLRERGLRIVGAQGVERFEPRLVTADELAAADEAARYDVVLLAVKGTALAAALADLAPAVGPDTVIVPFLNGLAHIDALTARFGAEAVLGGAVRVFTGLNEDGDIVQYAPLHSLTVGELSGGLTPRVEKLRELLDGAGFEVQAVPDGLAAMWGKWVFISTLGALTTLMRGSVGDVVAAPGGERLGPAILAEAAAVAAAAGYPLPEPDQAAALAMVTTPGSTATASMYRDVAAGQPVEVEPVFGDLVARARRYGVDTPLLDLATLQMRVYQLRLERERA